MTANRVITISVWVREDRLPETKALIENMIREAFPEASSVRAECVTREVERPDQPGDGWTAAGR